MAKHGKTKSLLFSSSKSADLTAVVKCAESLSRQELEIWVLFVTCPQIPLRCIALETKVAQRTVDRIVKRIKERIELGIAVNG